MALCFLTCMLRCVHPHQYYPHTIVTCIPEHWWGCWGFGIMIVVGSLDMDVDINAGHIDQVESSGLLSINRHPDVVVKHTGYCFIVIILPVC